MFEIIEINGYDQFSELGNKWNNVLERSKEKNVFLTWEYLSTYWKHFRYGKKLRILVITDRDHIIAIAPLKQSRYSFGGPFHYNVIEPLGYRSLTPEGADYTGLILSEREEECLQLLFDYLSENDDWDFLYMYDIPGRSTIPDLLRKVSKTIPFILESERGAACPYLPLPDSIDILISRLSKNLRQNLRKYMRRLKEDYKKIDFRKYDEFGSVKDTMDIFFNLHQKRCRAKNLPGVFASKEIRDFYLEVAQLFASNGWLALYFLTANDEPIAATYSIIYNQKMYFCLGGFDPEYSRYSIGNLMHQKTIEMCIQSKIKEYDFLKGDESYKFRWTRTYSNNLNIKIVNKKFTSCLYHWGIRTVKQKKMDRIFERFLPIKG